MGMTEKKFTATEIGSPALSHLPDRPSQAGMSAADLKAAFGYALRVKDLMTRFNGLIDELQAQTAADQLGATLPKNSVTNVQQALDYLLQYADSTAEKLQPLPDAVAALQAALSHLSQIVTDIENDLSPLPAAVVLLQTELKALTDTAAVTQGQVSGLRSSLDALTEKVDYLEGIGGPGGGSVHDPEKMDKIPEAGGQIPVVTADGNLTGSGKTPAKLAEKDGRLQSNLYSENAVRVIRQMTPTNSYVGAIPLNGPLGGGSTVGVLKLKMPAAWRNRSLMLRFWVDIFTYGDLRCKSFLIGGYFRADGVLFGPTAIEISNKPNEYSHTVRFGYDSDSYCVYIGELGDVQAYTTVTIRDLQVLWDTHDAFASVTGWIRSSIITSFDTETIVGTITSTLPNSGNRPIWYPLTLINGAIGSVSYCKVNGIVYVSGRDMRVPSSAVIATLPEGYRPVFEMVFGTTNYSVAPTASNIRILKNGEFHLNPVPGPANGGFSISFPAGT